MERGETVHITRRGKTVAVLLSEDEYERLCQGRKPPDFGNLVEKMRSDLAFEPLDWPQEEVDSWHDRRLVREFEWLE